MHRRMVFAALTLFATGCTHDWRAGSSVLADPREVASALGDPLPSTRASLADLPRLDAPHHTRPCCAFGMDIRADFAGMDVPFFEVGNVIEPDAIGHSTYDLPDAAPDPESNGLVYTCRGGWIDTAHVREDADITLFLALALAPSLESGTTITIPGHGATATLTLAPVPPSTITREGPLAVASALAAWATFRLSIWHEVSTWFGYQSVAGFSEKPSAFSLEDLYSDALGIHIAQAIVDEEGFHDEADYDAVLDAFIEEVLHRLDAQPRGISRSIMASLDGRWWDSTRRLPDNHLVLRRSFPPEGREIRPWRAEEAFAPDAIPEPLATACRGAETRPLTLTTHVGRTSARDLLTITWAPEGWADASLPFADPSRHIVDERELDRLTEAAHAGLEADLGVGFDRPGPRPP